MTDFTKLNTGHSLDVQFYEEYDPDFLWNKAQTLRLVTDNLGEFREFLRKVNDTDEGIDQKYIEAINAEIHFTEFHQFECFFALLIAPFQEKSHWIFLNDYRPSEIREKARQFLAHDIQKLTNGTIGDINNFILWAIYCGYGYPQDSENYERWIESLDGIEWMINRLATKYVDGVEYNAYKHGLRLHTGPSHFAVYPENQREKGFSWASDDSVRFLEIKKEGCSQRVQYSVKHFDPEEAITHLQFMNLVLGILKKCRLARLKREEIDSSLVVKMDRDAIEKLGRRGFKLGMPVNLGHAPQEPQRFVVETWVTNQT